MYHAIKWRFEVLWKCLCFISQSVCCMSEVVTMYAVSDALTLGRAVRGNCSWYVASLVTFMNSFSFVYVSNNQGPSGACCVGTRVKFLLCCSFLCKFPTSMTRHQYLNIPNTAFSRSPGHYTVHSILQSGAEFSNCNAKQMPRAQLQLSNWYHKAVKFWCSKWHIYV